MTRHARGRLRWWCQDRGSYTLETVICVVFLLPFLGLLAAYGLAGVFDSSVDNAANSAARAASQAADADLAQVRGRAAAEAALRQDDRNCTSSSVQIDTSGFAAAAGQCAGHRDVHDPLVPAGGAGTARIQDAHRDRHQCPGPVRRSRGVTCAYPPPPRAP